LKAWIERKAAPSKQKEIAADPNRSAAEWVLAIGGDVIIAIDGQDPARISGKSGRLPAGAVRMTSVELVKNSQVTAAGLTQVRGLEQLTSLNLLGSTVNEGLAIVGTLTSLTDLNLCDVSIGSGASGL